MVVRQDVRSPFDGYKAKSYWRLFKTAQCSFLLLGSRRLQQDSETLDSACRPYSMQHWAQKNWTKSCSLNRFLYLRQGGLITIEAKHPGQEVSTVPCMGRGPEVGGQSLQLQMHLKKGHHTSGPVGSCELASRLPVKALCLHALSFSFLRAICSAQRDELLLYYSMPSAKVLLCVCRLRFTCGSD